MGVTLMARLVDARTSKPLAGQRIGFGCTFGNSDPIVTDENGVAHFSMELSEGTECGTFQITSAFPGNSTYEPAWATANLTVVKGPSYLWIADRTSRAGMPVNLAAKLTNGSDEPIVGATVRFKLRGQTVGITTTDKSGFAAAVVVTGPLPGSYAITTTFKGDDGHEGSMAKGTLHLR